MSTIVEILPCQLGDHSGVRIRLRCGQDEKESKPFLNIDDGGHDFIDELLDRYEVDAIVDKAIKPGRDVYYDLSDAFNLFEDAGCEPPVDAEIVPLFPDDGGRPR